MAPPKVQKKPLKSTEKPIEKPISKSKKIKKKNYQNFSIYVYKLLQSVKTQDKIGIKKKSMLIMNDFVYDMLEKIAAEAGKLVSHSKKNTLNSGDVQAAVRLLVPGKLAKYANMNALKAITMYHNSQDKDK